MRSITRAYSPTRINRRTNRTHGDFAKIIALKVKVTGENEWHHRILCTGVQQGGVLGPLLFLAYINDLVDRTTCKIKLYADYTVLYTIADDHEASGNVLNYNTEQVEAWAKQWIVNFNPAKTMTMTVSFKRTIGTVLLN